MSLGGRFLVIVLLSAVLPLALAGVWLSRDAGRAGEALLERRMAETLAELAHEVGAEWLRSRSRLLDLAESPAVRQALTGGGVAAGAGPDAAEGPASPDVAEVAHRVEVRDAAGQVVRRYAAPGGLGGQGLRVSLPLHHLSGEPLGTLDAWLRLEPLLGRSAARTARTGGVIGMLDASSDLPVVNAPFDAHLLTGARFQLAGEEWITRRHVLADPAAVLVLAAPLDPYRQPFHAAARRGVLLILAVALTGLLAAALLTRQTTRPLAELVGASQAVARGQMDRRVRVAGPREVSQLGRAFNAMAEDLQRTVSTLAKREALAAVGEFAATLAHEIRNPLTAIRIDLQRVEEVSGDEARRRSLTDRMLESVRRLDRTVSGVLRVAGTGRVELAPVPLQEPLAAALELARPAIVGQGGELRAPAAAEPVLVLADRAALEQLLLNLLLNAGEARTGAGPHRVDVGVALTGGGTGPHGEPECAEIVIRDNGRGIPEAELERIFEPLYTTKRGGTGLGLAVAERIARAHGGEIAFETEPGRGTTVRVRIPLAAAAAAEPGDAGAAGAVAAGAEGWERWRGARP
jgi:signal transduction histidine kinase